MLALCRMSESKAENKMNKGFVAWAQYLEEWVIFHVALLPINSPSSQLGPKIISVRVCLCLCVYGHCVYFWCACVSLFKRTTARRHLNLPTWQLAPLITKSDTHQWMSNEAFLGELWLTMGLGSTPQVWITYYVLLKYSVKYTEFWSQTNSFKETIQVCSLCCTIDPSHKIYSCMQKPHLGLFIQSKLVLNKGAEGKSLHSPCLTLEAHSHSW